MPLGRKKPTAGEYVLSFLGSALPGYIQGKQYKDQQDKLDEANAKKMSEREKLHSANLYKTMNDTNLPLSQRRDAHYRIGAEVGNIEPYPQEVPKEDTSIADSKATTQAFNKSQPRPDKPLTDLERRKAEAEIRKMNLAGDASKALADYRNRQTDKDKKGDSLATAKKGYLEFVKRFASAVAEGDILSEEDYNSFNNQYKQFADILRENGVTVPENLAEVNIPQEKVEKDEPWYDIFGWSKDKEEVVDPELKTGTDGNKYKKINGEWFLVN